MQRSKLIAQSLAYYWRTNLAVVLGVATAVAVLAGALLVGESVRASLRQLFLARLGNADSLIASSGFFSEQLALRIESDPSFSNAFRAACPIIALEGFAIHEKSRHRASAIQVYGVDERFWKFHGLAGLPGADREILLSAALASELGAVPGDAILVRIRKPSDIPAESLHGRKEDPGRTIRLQLGTQAAGFDIRPQQGAVRAAFIPLRRLQQDLDRRDEINAILLSEKPAARAGETAEALLRASASLEDIGIRVRQLGGALSVESTSTLLSDDAAGAARKAAAELGLKSVSVFTYLANRVRSGAREIPYALVTAIEPASEPWGPAEGAPPPILLNEWAARDLEATPGAEIVLEYFAWKEGGRLETESASFRLQNVVPLQRDPDLAPPYPGITDSDNLGDWDPPFPVDLTRVRPRDEEYWDRFRTTPKAFIPLAAGQKLWPSRFGSLTSLRVLVPERDHGRYRERLRASLDPLRLGFAVIPVRAQGLEASRGATDFGEYFVYFSFFLVVSALLLAGLFFKLGVEQRLREVGVLQTLGFPEAVIRRLFLTEGAVLAGGGALLGMLGSVAYASLILLGLRTWWKGAVGTDLLQLHVSGAALAIGGAAGIAVALAGAAWTLRALRRFSPRSLVATGPTGLWPVGQAGGLSLNKACTTGASLALAALLLMLGAWAGRVNQVAGFFGAGLLLLVTSFLFQWAWFSRRPKAPLRGAGFGGLSRLGFRNVAWRPSQSVLCIALIASATFILVAVDAFRRDDRLAAGSDPKSGTGGYPLLAESLLPLFHDPNSEAGREALNLNLRPGAMEGVKFVPFRLRPGDDASCLNLYRPTNPRILGASDIFIGGGRFAFQNSLAETAEEKSNPWLLLRHPLPDGAIPAVVDANSMTYVLHRKLGDEVLIEQGEKTVRLRLVATLVDSVFQKELLIAEENFLRAFPGEQGYRFFLIDAPNIDTPHATDRVVQFLEETLSDYDFDVTSTAGRLADFHRVENTYLSTFQALGGLGLLLGTAGLGAVLLRNVLARRRELALLLAVGYRPLHLGVLVVAENALLLLAGLVSGTAAALLAIVPAMASRGGQTGGMPGLSLAALLVAVVIVGLAASLGALVVVVRSPLLAALRSE